MRKGHVGIGALVVSASIALSGIFVLSQTASPVVAHGSSLCPYTQSQVLALASNPTSAVWMDPTYQAAHSPVDLANEVIACEEVGHPSEGAEMPAELALISLNTSPDGRFQNLNMLLNSGSSLTYNLDFYNLGIPSLSFEDGPGGILYRSHTSAPQPTVYPNELPIGASLDPSLALAYGQQLANEAKALHYMGVQAPDLNLDRIPNWGRSPETFGEDPELAGQMGTAETTGILQNDSFVVLKHFGTYGQETSRKSTNNIISLQALHDTYLRSFAMTMDAIATSNQVPTTSQIAVMCSYGDLNGTRSCTNPDLVSTLSHLPFSGLVRSDLDTVTTSTKLLTSSVNLIKPLVTKEFQPYGSSATTATLVDRAATELLTVMFSAGLVNKATWKISRTIGSFTSSLAASGVSLANQIIQRGAVLLKNSSTIANHQPGSLPLAKSDGPIVIEAPMAMSTTCSRLASWLAAKDAIVARCAFYNRTVTPSITVIPRLPSSSGGKLLTRSATWKAPTTGAYAATIQTFGYSWLKMNGSYLLQQPGITQFYAPQSTVINVKKGQEITFQVGWQSAGPTVTVTPLAPLQTTVAASLRGAHTALVMAYDAAAEGEDRYQLSLPFSQDVVIQSTAATGVATSVMLFTTGPVTMPWLSSVKSVIEMWNPIGNPPIDSVTENYIPAYGLLLDGRVSPSGHLPITFPATQNQSPMNVGASHFNYWPGMANNANLTLSPLNGLVIGYGWYQKANWPVLFPFGYGLTYATMTNSFDIAHGCGSNKQHLCLSAKVGFTDVGRQARDGIQLYVAQPSSGGTRPALVLGYAGSVLCRDSNGPTGQCANSVDQPMTVTSDGVGVWNATTNTYGFISGCYTFVLASDARSAFGVLQNPSSAPGAVASVSFNGTTWGTTKSGTSC